MKKTNLQIIDQLPNGTPLEAFEGKVLKVWGRKSGENEHGAWSFQNLEITNGAQKVTVKLKNRELFPESWKNRDILVTHGTHGKTGKAIGIEVKDETVKDEEVRRIFVNEHAEIALLDGNDAPPRREQPRDDRRQEQPQEARERPRQDDRPQERQQTRQEPQERRQEQRQPEQSHDAIREAKTIIAQIRTLHVLCYDAAVATAHDIHARHGYAFPPGTVGIIGDKYLMEAIRRTNLQSLPLTAPERKGRPLSELLPFCEAAWDAVTERRVKVEEQAKQTVQKPAETTKHQPADQDGGDWDAIEAEIEREKMGF